MSYMRVCACINADAIRHNFNEIKKSLPCGTKLMPVIKADGYGHGAKLFADILGEESSYFAVAIIEEALALRQNGVETPILLLGYTFPQAYAEAIENNITVTIFSYEDAQAVSKAASELGKIAKIHIAIDTGMSRIGFSPNEESADVVKAIASLENIRIEGMFTHFAASDEEDRHFTHIQAERFLAFKKMLQSRGVEIEICHCANSAAIMQYKEYAFDMMRPGIILYGLYPSDEVDRSVLDLQPVMELESHVAFVKTIQKGDSVSYGRTFIAQQDMRIATIPVGYADGYPRLLSNRGRVIINGKYAPIVGRVCMDQFMVDVSSIDVKVGDKVTLMGKQGELFVSADEIAKYAQTINYEIVCGIGKRVPRVVRNENA